MALAGRLKLQTNTVPVQAAEPPNISMDPRFGRIYARLKFDAKVEDGPLISYR